MSTHTKTRLLRNTQTDAPFSQQLTVENARVMFDGFEKTFVFKNAGPKTVGVVGRRFRGGPGATSGSPSCHGGSDPLQSPLSLEMSPILPDQVANKQFWCFCFCFPTKNIHNNNKTNKTSQLVRISVECLILRTDQSQAHPSKCIWRRMSSAAVPQSAHQSDPQPPPP